MAVATRSTRNNRSTRSAASATAARESMSRNRKKNRRSSSDPSARTPKRRTVLAACSIPRRSERKTGSRSGIGARDAKLDLLPVAAAAIPPSRPSLPSRRLFDLFRRGSWDEAIDRCRSHPRDAEYRTVDSRGVLHPPSDDDQEAKAARGATPLHMAVHCGAPSKVIRAVLAAQPAYLDERDDPRGFGATPLHVLAVTDFGTGAERERLDVLRAFAERFPRPLAELEMVFPPDLPTDVVDIIRGYLPHPASVRSNGSTPLSAFLRASRPNEGCIRLLASSSPGGFAPDPILNITPLHESIRPVARGAVGLDLLRYMANLAAAAHADADYPSADAGARVPPLLARMRCDGTEDDSPLHLACQWHDSNSVANAATAADAGAGAGAGMLGAVSILVRAEPRAASLRNTDGKTPLECLIDSCTDGEYRWKKKDDGDGIRKRSARGPADDEIRDEETDVFCELAGAYPEALVEPILFAEEEGGVFRIPRPEGWPGGGGMPWNAYAFVRLRGPSRLASALGDVVERHVGRSRRLLWDGTFPRDV